MWWIKLKFISKYLWIPRSFWLLCNITHTFLASSTCDNKSSYNSFSSTNCWDLKVGLFKMSSCCVWVFPWAWNRCLRFFLLEHLIVSLYSCPCSASHLAHCSSEPSLPTLPLPCPLPLPPPPPFCLPTTHVSPAIFAHSPAGRVGTVAVVWKLSDTLLFTSFLSLTWPEVNGWSCHFPEVDLPFSHPLLLFYIHSCGWYN